MSGTPRMRMFAGPNGSGKSVLKSYLPPELLGTYLNPDEIEATIKHHGEFDLRVAGFSVSEPEVLAFFRDSELLRNAGHGDAWKSLRFNNACLGFRDVEVNSYFASVLADYLRGKLLQAGDSFTFETVMSHPGKVALLEAAQGAGYRTYLYYVATDDPEINVSRVRNRVKLGGHAVAKDKVVARYHRSLDLLIDAIRSTNRAYIFDNSTDSADRRHTWLAEITDGRVLELKTDSIPSWFKRSVLDKIQV